MAQDQDPIYLYSQQRTLAAEAPKGRNTKKEANKQTNKQKTNRPANRPTDTQTNQQITYGRQPSTMGNEQPDTRTENRRQTTYGCQFSTKR